MAQGFHINAYKFGSDAYQTESSEVYTENGTITIRVQDAVGNFTEQSFTIDNIDKIEPSISSVISSGYTPGSWSKNSVTLVITASDDIGGSGLCCNGSLQL